MPDRPWKDEYTLLCEKCGYVIEGLDTDGNCPECGKPIAESLPERRIGTPWQQSPGVKSLLATWWMTLRHPLRTLDVMQVASGKLRLLSWLTITVSSLTVSAGYVLPTLYMIYPQEAVYLDKPAPSTRWLGLLTIPIFAIIPLVLLPILTWIETRGLVIISRTRGFRVDRQLARTITSHGCAGWLLLSILYMLFNNLGSVLIQLNTAMPEPLSEPTNAQKRVLEYIQIFGSHTPQWVYWVDRILWGTGVLIGFLFFETFAYLGLRRLKYANRVRPEA